MGIGNFTTLSIRIFLNEYAMRQKIYSIGISRRVVAAQDKLCYRYDKPIANDIFLQIL